MDYDEAKSTETGIESFKVKIESTDESKVYGDNHCELVISTDQKFSEGVNLLFLQHRRDYFIGSYDIDCKIGDKVIK